MSAVCKYHGKHMAAVRVNVHHCSDIGGCLHSPFTLQNVQECEPAPNVQTQQSHSHMMRCHPRFEVQRQQGTQLNCAGCTISVQASIKQVAHIAGTTTERSEPSADLADYLMVANHQRYFAGCPAAVASTR
jgi:hypothetical protein